MLYILIVLGIFIIICIIKWISDVNFFRTVRYEISSEKLEKDYSFVLLTDLHCKRFGPKNVRLLSEVKKLNPDSVLISGDLITANKRVSTKPAEELIESLSGQYPIYYGMGNHENKICECKEMYGSMYDDYSAELLKSGVTMMGNEVRSVQGNNIDIYSFVLPQKYFEWKSRNKLTPSKEDIEEKIGACRKERFNILLAHNPDFFPVYAKWEPDLVLSGHNHGGIIGVPFFGGLISPRIEFFPKFDGGEFTDGNSKMILSRGLGTHTIPVRFMDKAELVYIKLKAEKNGTA